MRSALRSITRSLGRWMPARKPSRPSRLLGIYLSQANYKGQYSSEFQKTRERQNGKYSPNRERT